MSFDEECYVRNYFFLLHASASVKMNITFVELILPLSLISNGYVKILFHIYENRHTNDPPYFNYQLPNGYFSIPSL